jgi:hypothetical protein
MLGKQKTEIDMTFCFPHRKAKKDTIGCFVHE